MRQRGWPGAAPVSRGRCEGGGGGGHGGNIPRSYRAPVAGPLVRGLPPRDAAPYGLLTGTPPAPCSVAGGWTLFWYVRAMQAVVARGEVRAGSGGGLSELAMTAQCRSLVSVRDRRWWWRRLRCLCCSLLLPSRRSCGRGGRRTCCSQSPGQGSPTYPSRPWGCANTAYPRWRGLHRHPRQSPTALHREGVGAVNPISHSSAHVRDAFPACSFAGAARVPVRGPPLRRRRLPASRRQRRHRERVRQLPCAFEWRRISRLAPRSREVPLRADVVFEDTRRTIVDAQGREAFVRAGGADG